MNESGISYKVHIGYNGNKEYKLIDLDRCKCYYYDFAIEDLSLIIEFDGEKFHPTVHDIINRDFSNLLYINTVYDARKTLYNDVRKRIVANENGFELLRVSSKNKNHFNINLIKEKIIDCIKSKEN